MHGFFRDNLKLTTTVAAVRGFLFAATGQKDYKNRF